MSIRVHELAKKIGRENKETIEILKKYNLDVKSVSSTVDNITAEAIVEEYAVKVEEQPAAKEETEQKQEEPKKPTLPPGVFVKSEAQVIKEHEEKEAARKAEKEAGKKAKQPKAETAKPAKVSPPPVATQKKTGTAPIPAPAPKPATAPKPAVAPKPAAVAPKPATAPKPAVAPKPAAVAPKPATAPKPAVAPKPVIKPKTAAAHKPAAAAPKAVIKPKAATAPSAAPKPSGIAPAPAPAPTPLVKANAPVEVTENEDETLEPGEKKKLQIKPPVVVKDFAGRLGLKPFRLISELMEMGIFSSMNQTIDEQIAAKIADKHGFVLDIRHRGEGTVTKESKEKTKKAKVTVDDPESLEERPPVVCIMGHVDHGKTTLIDQIRKADVAGGEHGGITQHVAAYQVVHNNNKVTFIDTPGHAAFSKIRERGANVTDIVIIVVAADDGFMPQTDEALKFAKRAQAAIMVAINKIDAKGANVDRVKQQMQERGIAPEDWGGETVCVPVSALKGENIDQLMEMIQLQAEVEELRANPKGNAEGVIVEAQMEQGRGATATVIVDRGTLKKGDSILCGTVYCKARALLDENGKALKQATPSTPVKIIGWSDTPLCGARFERSKNDREAKRIADERLIEQKKVLAETEAPTKKPGETGLDALFAAISATQKKSLVLILKADVGGSVEAIRSSIEEIDTEKVSVKIISSEIGPVTKNDVTRASTSGATIIAFNVGVENGVRSLAKHENVEIYPSNIIYELIDTVKDLMADQLDPVIKEVHVGMAEVRAVFTVGKRNVAGCMVTEGKILRDKKARLIRDDEVIMDTKVDTLKRFKDDVNEVRTGFECGIHVFDMEDYKEGDKIECYDIEKIKPSL